MIVITGAAGFIGSVLAKFMKNIYHGEIVIVDDFSRIEKASNLLALDGMKRIERSDFFEWLNQGHGIEVIFHIGARTDTTEFDYSILEALNLEYTKKVWDYCVQCNTTLIYASSAATYGDGEFGYSDAHEVVEQLKPLNPYGISKNEFDKWALNQNHTPPFWAGMKFFNVFGPNEYHKGRMASVIIHAYKQIKEQETVRLFRSHHPDFEDGKQLRDFIYVKDVIDVLYFLMQKQPHNGIFNLGTGKARSFLDLAAAVFRALNIPEQIRYLYWQLK